MLKSQEIMKSLSKLYDERCFVTHQPFKIKGFVLHHLWYIEGDVVRKNYPKGVKGREQYIIDLEPLVREQPFRFILITNGIHTKLDHVRNGVSRLKRVNQYRFIVALLLTRK